MNNDFISPHRFSKSTLIKLFVCLLIIWLLSSCSSRTSPISSSPTTTDSSVTSATQIAQTDVNQPAPTIVVTEMTEKRENQHLILATTTSTQDSGLLDVLIPLFESQSGYVVKTIAVGTGQAIQMGKEGNADVLLVHDPSSEKQFMEEGYGKDRVLIMHNDFILVGPPEDPANVKGKTIGEAFQAIATKRAIFISRGDDSGTHKKELRLWGMNQLDPHGQSWYVETGQGMGASLTVASEKSAYILTDRATFLAYRGKIDLQIMVEGDVDLLNVYHGITVNPDRFPVVNYEASLAFLNFLISPETQQIIGEFGVQEYGEPLFFPDADKTDADFGLE